MLWETRIEEIIDEYWKTWSQKGASEKLKHPKYLVIFSKFCLLGGFTLKLLL